jgi:D-glycero-D-manno-heptose 1,7-bisphosphate phosphatase
VKRGAFFLDRDGTINIDHVYINDPKQIELIDGSAEAIAKAREVGFAIVVVTNQSGIGRKIIEPGALPRIHSRMEQLLVTASPGARIDRYEMCIHRPDENCDCRKPSPKMVLEAARQLNIDLQQSVFVGDRLSDVATGKNAGCGLSILVRTGKGLEEEKLIEGSGPAEQPDFVADDLAEAVGYALLRVNQGN